MKILSDIQAYRAWRKQQSHHTRIGLVPTMGALHEGHASLVKRSAQENDLTVVSIFVNPTQFGPNEDFETYPRNLTSDAQMLEALGVDVVFAPEVSTIYPAGVSQIQFHIRDIDKKLCGASRPGHMNGVVQVVSILFHLIQPTHAYFGLKDYQQCLILQHLVRELHFPLEIVPCPIIREKDGLALSSRNAYLTSEERQQALFLSRMLNAVHLKKEEFGGVEDARLFVQESLKNYPLIRLDYFDILNGETLADISDLSPASHPHAFIAAYVGTTRLIDNLAV
ncbi:MAG: pantoate--beta-alanine ligase [Bacteroidota bacterium]